MSCQHFVFTAAVHREALDMLRPFAVGSGIVGLMLWATRLQKAPKMEPALWKALAPVALFHTLG
jgi:hypothetical protein